MLGTKNYTPQYIHECNARIQRALDGYRRLAGAPDEAFESSYFSNLVLLLEYFFVHRLRTVEGKEGNALNEVRILCNSILGNNSVMTTDNVADLSAFTGLNTIKLSPERSVLKYRPGDSIRLTQADFVRLSEAFFAEMERKFG